MSPGLRKFLSLVSFVVLAVTPFSTFTAQAGGVQAQVFNTMSRENLENTNLMVCLNDKLQTQMPYFLQPGGPSMDLSLAVWPGGPSMDPGVAFDQTYSLKVIDTAHTQSAPSDLMCFGNNHPVLAETTFTPKITDSEPVKINITGNATPNSESPLEASLPPAGTPIVYMNSTTGNSGVILNYSSTVCVNDEAAPRRSNNGFLDLEPGNYQISYPDFKTYSTCGLNPKQNATVVAQKYTKVNFGLSKNPAYQVSGVSLEVITPPQRTVIKQENIGNGSCAPNPVPKGGLVTCSFPLTGITNGYIIPTGGIWAQVGAGSSGGSTEQCKVDVSTSGSYGLACFGLSTTNFDDSLKGIVNVHVYAGTPYEAGTQASIRAQVNIKAPQVITPDNIVYDANACTPNPVVFGQTTTCYFPLQGSDSGYVLPEGGIRANITLTSFGDNQVYCEVVRGNILPQSHLACRDIPTKNVAPRALNNTDSQMGPDIGLFVGKDSIGRLRSKIVVTASEEQIRQAFPASAPSSSTNSSIPVVYIIKEEDKTQVTDYINNQTGNQIVKTTTQTNTQNNTQVTTTVTKVVEIKSAKGNLIRTGGADR